MSSGTVIAVVVVVAIVGIVALIALQAMNPAFAFPWFNFTFPGFQFPGWGNNTNPPGTSLDICNVFVSNFPTYMGTAETICTLGGGQWECEDDRIGCYNTPAWNTTACYSTEAQAVKAFCVSIGGSWTCHSTQVSCEG